MKPGGDTVTLHDGRKLGYAEYGARGGVPVIGFFGTSARFFRPPDDDTTAAGIRLITVERPGLGLSDFQPGRTLLDTPNDVAQLATALGLDRFAVVGASEGGPFAAACAYKIPDRLTAVSLVSSLSPFQATGVLEGMQGSLKTIPAIANRLPWLLYALMGMTAWYIRRNPQQTMKLFGALPENDRQVLKDHPELEAYLVRDAAELYRQGGRGAAEDVRIVARPWGFDLKDIRVQVYLWQGEEDHNVPFAMGRYLANAIPGCKATFVPGAGHFLIYSRWREIAKELVQGTTRSR